MSAESRGAMKSSAVEELKRTPEPLVVSVGLGVLTRLGDRRSGEVRVSSLSSRRPHRWPPAN